MIVLLVLVILILLVLDVNSQGNTHIIDTTTINNFIIDTNNKVNRNLKYYDGDRHFELLPLYNAGSSSIIRRKLTHTPTKSPTNRRPTRRPTKRPTRRHTRSPTRSPTRGPTVRPTTIPTTIPTTSPTTSTTPATTTTPTTSFFTITSTYQLSSPSSPPSPPSYITINSNTQLTLFESTKCSVLPYYITDNNFIIIYSIGAGTITKKSQGVVELALLGTNTSITFTTSSITKTCSYPNTDVLSFVDVQSSINVGDIYLSTLDRSFTRTTTDELVLTDHEIKNNVLTCSSYKASIFGPFLTSGGSIWFTIGGDDQGYQLQFIDFGEFFPDGDYKKVNTIPTQYKCPDTDIELDITHVQNTNILASVQSSIVVNNTIISYGSSYSSVDVYNYETGVYNQATYNIKKRYSSDRYNARPLFFNGTELFLLGDNDNSYYLYGYYYGGYYDLPQAVHQTLKSVDVEYGIIDNKPVLLYAKRKNMFAFDDIYSYNLKTQVEVKMNIISKLSESYAQELSFTFAFINNKIVWRFRGVMVYYDVVTQTTGRYTSTDLDNIHHFSNTQILTSYKNELLLMFGTGLNDFSKSNIVVTFGPHSPTTTKNIYKLTSDLLINDEANRIMYYFNTNNELFVYDDMLTGASICQKLTYKQLANGVVYTSDNSIRSITQLSNNNGFIVYGGIFTKVLPLSTPRPQCMPQRTLQRVSSTLLSQEYKTFLGSPSSDLILISTYDKYSYPSNSNSHKFFNTNSKLETTITFNQLPSKPSNFPSGVAYALKYPISINSDNDYWITSSPSYLIPSSNTNNNGISYPSNSGTSIFRNTTTIYNGDGYFIKTIDISSATTINKIPLPDRLWGVDKVAYVGSNTIIAYLGNSLLIYDTITLKTIGYIDINNDITTQLDTTDWEIAGITGTKTGLAIYVSFYNANTDNNADIVNIYKLI